MAKFYCMGNYTAQAFQGFLKDPTSDRSKAAQAAGEAVGAKFIILLLNLCPGGSEFA